MEHTQARPMERADPRIAHLRRAVCEFGGIDVPLSLSVWCKIGQYTRRLPVWACYLSATLVVLTAASLYSWESMSSAGHPFILFFTAIVISAVFFAHGSGLWAALLGTALIARFMVSHSYDFAKLNSSELLLLLLFTVVGASTAIIIETLHRAFYSLTQLNHELAAARDRLAAAEQEKDVLLDELTHRLKNELTTMIALTRLQAQMADDTSARRELIAASERLHMISRVHQRLTWSEDRSSVDIRSFLTDLVADLSASLIGPRPIAITADICSDQFPPSRAIPLGLITNELITNALKYAFPKNRPGTISVRLARENHGYVLTVRDDGLEALSTGTSKSGLGQRLIRGLAQQLGGTFESSLDPGGKIFTVRF